MNVSYAIPDPMGVASMTEAGLIGPFLLMLQVFALQDANAWIELEKLLHKTLPLPNKHWAGRDAMARIMYRRAEIGIDDRAIQIGTRASLYRRATREAELVLRGWLLAAATIYNGADDVRATKLGRTQGRGQSTESWWHPERPFIQRESKSTLNTGRPRTARTAQLVREHSIEVWNAATATTRERWEDGRRALWNLPTSAPA
ncbi:MAG: hypothetical protein ABIQ70_07040 [Dokdonella sp.]